MAKTPAVSSAAFRAAFVVLILAFILLVVAFITPNWTEVTLGNVLISRTGLWKTYSAAGDNCSEGIHEGESWYVAVQSFEALGLACLILVLTMSLVLLVAVSNQRLARVNVYTGVFAGWYVAVQTFEALGLACLIFVLIMSLVLLVAVCNQRLARVNVYTGVFAGIFIITGTSTYTYKTELEHIGYSCWMSWLSAVALVVAIILLECARKKAYRRQISLTHAEVICEEMHGYHSYPMQELSPKTKRANRPLVVHHVGYNTQGHSASPTLSFKNSVK